MDARSRRSKRYVEKHRQLAAEVAASRIQEPDKQSRKAARNAEYRQSGGP